MSNDSDPDDDPLSLSSVTQPISGETTIVNISGNSFVNYTPAPDFAGNDTFSYDISDDSGAASTGNVNVEIFENSMHVNGILLRARLRRTISRAAVMVQVVDSQGEPVDGALVSGKWDGDAFGEVSQETYSRANMQGIVEFRSDTVYGDSTTFTFTVTDITIPNWHYDSTLNVSTTTTKTVP